LSSETLSSQTISAVEPDAAPVAAVAQVVDNTSEPASVAEIENSSSQQNPVKADLEMVASEPALPQIAIATSAEAPALESVPAANTEQALATDPVAAESLRQPETPAQLALEPEPETEVSGATAVEVQPGQGRLQRDLATSQAWIDRSERKIGTLQILLLSEKRFDEQAYYGYVDQLEARAIDTSTLRILRTLTRGQEVYSVVYGEYESWQAAGNAKRDLPEILGKNSPIPRSVGGLLDEIRRLEGQN
jgi:septal ring-binding cell division protein DamX